MKDKNALDSWRRNHELSWRWDPVSLWWLQIHFYKFGPNSSLMLLLDFISKGYQWQVVILTFSCDILLLLKDICQRFYIVVLDLGFCHWENFLTTVWVCWVPSMLEWKSLVGQTPSFTHTHACTHNGSTSDGVRNWAVWMMVP